MLIYIILQTYNQKKLILTRSSKQQKDGNVNRLTEQKAIRGIDYTTDIDFARGALRLTDYRN